MDTPVETKPCPLCAETILAVAVKCKYCGSDLVEGTTSDGPKRSAKPSNAGRWNASIILLGAIYVLLLSFHIVIDVPTVIPKDTLSLSDTFVTVEELIERFNDASGFEKGRLNQMNLYRSLEKKGAITRGATE